MSETTIIETPAGGSNLEEERRRWALEQAVHSSRDGNIDSITYRARRFEHYATTGDFKPPDVNLRGPGGL